MRKGPELPLEKINPQLREVLEVLPQRARLGVLSVLTEEGEDDEFMLLLDQGAFSRKLNKGEVDPVKSKFRKALNLHPNVIKTLEEKAKAALNHREEDVVELGYVAYVKPPEDPTDMILNALDVRMELDGVPEHTRSSVVRALRNVEVKPALQEVVTGRGNGESRVLVKALPKGAYREQLLGVMRGLWPAINTDDPATVLREIHATDRARLEAARAAREAAEAAAENK